MRALNKSHGRFVVRLHSISGNSIAHDLFQNGMRFGSPEHVEMSAMLRFSF